MKFRTLFRRRPLGARLALTALSAAAALLPGCDRGEDEASQPRGSISSRQRSDAAAELAGLSDHEFSGLKAWEHADALCKLGPRPSGSEAYEAQLRYLEQHLRAAGWRTQRDVFSGPEGLRFTNLRAVFIREDSATASDAASASAPGEAPRPLLLSCHIDTKRGIPGFVGADDGASGAAVLLELARSLPKRQAQRAEQIELIFFDGEESLAERMTETDGLYGSRYDVARRGAGGLPRWQINLDMVGGRDKRIGVPMADTPESLLMLYEMAVERLGLSPETWGAVPTGYLDDHRPYAFAGVDTLNLIARFQEGGWWHTPADDMSRICPLSLHETGRLVQQLIRQLLP